MGAEIAATVRSFHPQSSTLHLRPDRAPCLRVSVANPTKSNHSDKNQAKIRPYQTRKMKSNHNNHGGAASPPYRHGPWWPRRKPVSVPLRLCGQSQFKTQHSKFKTVMKIRKVMQGNASVFDPLPPAPLLPGAESASPFNIQNSKFTIIKTIRKVMQGHASVFDTPGGRAPS